MQMMMKSRWVLSRHNKQGPITDRVPTTQWVTWAEHRAETCPSLTAFLRPCYYYRTHQHLYHCAPPHSTLISGMLSVTVGRVGVEEGRTGKTGPGKGPGDRDG